MQREKARKPSALVGTLSLLLAGSLVGTACSKKEEPKPAAPGEVAKTAAPATEAPVTAPPKEAQPMPSGRRPKRALALALSQFSGATPKPARLEFIAEADGTWKTTGFEDPDSNVFHKGLALMWPGETPKLITLGGMKAAVKSWRLERRGLQVRPRCGPRPSAASSIACATPSWATSTATGASTSWWARTIRASSPTSSAARATSGPWSGSTSSPTRSSTRSSSAT